MPQSRKPSAAPASSYSEQAAPASGLAQSIMSDGGLGFLQERMEEKLGALFEKATRDNPELAAQGPGTFFDTSADISPEATADRIVGFALGLKGTFARQNEDLSQAEMMAKFEVEIRRGIEEGFGNATSILRDLELMEGDVQDNVDTTWDLVQEKLNDFFNTPTEEDA